MNKLAINKCQCLYCLDIIQSTYRHHFVKCKCGAIFTDGGLDYIRRGYGKPENTEFAVIPIVEDFFPIKHLEQ